jgi:hypothetical protein
MVIGIFDIELKCRGSDLQYCAYGELCAPTTQDLSDFCVTRSTLCNTTGIPPSPYHYHVNDAHSDRLQQIYTF